MTNSNVHNKEEIRPGSSRTQQEQLTPALRQVEEWRRERKQLVETGVA